MDWPPPEIARAPSLRALAVAHPVIVDARLSLDAQKWRDAGWTYRAPGKP